MNQTRELGALLSSRQGPARQPAFPRRPGPCMADLQMPGKNQLKSGVVRFGMERNVSTISLSRVLRGETLCLAY